MGLILIIKDLEILIDDEDFERIKLHSWHIEKSNGGLYLRSKINSKNIRLHRFLLNPSKNQIVDHINGNTLDNRKENLRICTAKENSRNMKMHKDNKSGHKGVHLNKNRYIATIYTNNKNKYLGSFKTAIEAARAYNKAAIEIYGDFAKLNEVD